MSKRIGAVLFMLGLVLTLAGAGGAEHSVTDWDLLKSVAVAVVGLLITFAGTVGLRGK